MNYAEICIIKRDGKTEPFSLDKIVRAITKAFRAGGITDEGQAVEQIASDVAAAITKADISVEEIAKRCNRSLTSFKKEFFRIYGTSPHQWLIRQRLIHARLLLISTDKAIAEIGTACAFPNTSHFIKLFRKQYGMTPATYRNRHRGPEELQPTPQAEAAVRETAVSVTA